MIAAATSQERQKLEAARAPTSPAHDSVTVAAWTLVSRATGFLRVVAIGAVLGPTFLANMFIATNAVPSLTYAAVAGPILALVVVPAIIRATMEQGPSAGALLLRRLSGLLVSASIVVALALIMASPVLAWTLTLGVPGPDDRARALRITIVLLLLVAPQVVLYTVAALGAAAQQSRGRFAVAAAAPALENVGLIVTLAVFASVYQPGLEVDEVPGGSIVVLGVGATLSVAIHALIQVRGSMRAGLSILPIWGWRSDPLARATARRLMHSVSVASFFAASFYFLLVIASSVRGGVLVIQMAHAVYGVPLAIGARAVTTAVLPRMSAASKSDDHRGYAVAWRQAMSYTTIAGLPPLCVLVAFAGPIAEILANGEMRSHALVASLSACIGVLGFAQLAGSVYEIGRQALFARLDINGARLAGAATFCATVAFGTATMLLPETMPRLVGLSVVILLADLAGAAIVISTVRRAIRPEPAIDLRLLRAAVLAACSMLPAIGAGWLIAGTDGGGRVFDLSIIISMTALGAVIFLLTLSAITSRWRAEA